MANIIDIDAVLKLAIEQLKAIDSIIISDEYYTTDVTEEVMEDLLSKMCYDDLLHSGDAPSSGEPAQPVECTLEQGMAADISDDGPKDDVLDVVVGKDIVPVKSAEVRNMLGDLVGWLDPDVTAPQLGPRQWIFSAVWKSVRRVLPCACCIRRDLHQRAQPSPLDRKHRIG